MEKRAGYAAGGGPPLRGGGVNPGMVQYRA